MSLVSNSKAYKIAYEYSTVHLHGTVFIHTGRVTYCSDAIRIQMAEPERW